MKVWMLDKNLTVVLKYLGKSYMGNKGVYLAYNSKL